MTRQPIYPPSLNSTTSISKWQWYCDQKLEIVNNEPLRDEFMGFPFIVHYSMREGELRSRSSWDCGCSGGDDGKKSSTESHTRRSREIVSLFNQPANKSSAHRRSMMRTKEVYLSTVDFRSSPSNLLHLISGVVVASSLYLCSGRIVTTWKCYTSGPSVRPSVHIITIITASAAGEDPSKYAVETRDGLEKFK